MDLPIQVPERRKYDVVGFGTNTVDHLMSVPRFPSEGEKIELAGYSIMPGGEVASTLCGLARLGFTTSYAGSFGSDEAGKIGRASLENEGIDTSFSRCVEGSTTRTSFILVSRDTGERTIVWRSDSLLTFAPDEVQLGLASLGRILHLTAHDTAAATALARAAKAASTIVSLDLDEVFEGVEDLLPLVDICITSAELPQKLTGEADIVRALGSIRGRFGCAIVGATLGERGSILLANDQAIRTTIIPVPGGCVDTTGAGDAFRTGFLAGVLDGRSVAECSLNGNAVASLACRKPGARDGLPNRDELQTLLKNAGHFSTF